MHNGDDIFFGALGGAIIIVFLCVIGFASCDGGHAEQRTKDAQLVIDVKADSALARRIDPTFFNVGSK